MPCARGDATRHALTCSALADADAVCPAGDGSGASHQRVPHCGAALCPGRGGRRLAAAQPEEACTVCFLSVAPSLIHVPADSTRQPRKTHEANELTHHEAQSCYHPRSICRFDTSFVGLEVLVNDNASRIFVCLMMNDGKAQVRMPSCFHCDTVAEHAFRCTGMCLRLVSTHSSEA